MVSFAVYEPEAGGEHLPVVVRPAVASDVDAVVAVGLRSGREVRPDAYRRALDDPERCVLVATADLAALDPDDDTRRDARRDAPQDPPRVPAPAARQVVGWGQTSHHTAATDPAPTGHYLAGVTVDPGVRRRGIGTALTQARLDWVAGRAEEVFFVVNARNLASIALHRPWRFEEVARGPRLAGVTFEGGVGLLLRAPLASPGAGTP